MTKSKKTKKAKNKPKFLELHVDYDSETETISDTLGEDGPWSGYREEDIYLTVNSLRRDTNDAFCESIKVTEDMFNADELFLVVVRYSDGSTFGQTSGLYEFVAAFDNEKDCKELREEIKLDARKSSYGFRPKTKNINYSSSRGLLYTPWKGYFARLSSVEILSLPVLDKSLEPHY